MQRPILEILPYPINIQGKFLFCDFVVINKVDLVPASRVKEIRQLVESFNPRVRILESIKGAIDIRFILDQDLYKSRNINLHEDPGSHDHSDHVHELYSTYSWTSDEPLHPMKFQDFVNRKLPTNVYRAKGIVDFGLKGHMRKYIFQLVGVRPEIVWENWNESPATSLVFIGQKIDSKLLKKELEACIDPKPDEQLDDNIELKLPKKADL